MRFTDELRAAAEPIWTAQHAHPFVRGIGDGTLDPDAFRVYVRQDYLFLVEYGRVLALASARAPRLELQRRFAELAQETLGTEMDLHRRYAAAWGVSADELEREEPAPLTRAYADFLLRTGALGDFAELVAALLPCMWGYAELGRALPRPDHELYAQWVEMYAGEDFQRLAEWCRDVCDEAAQTGDRERMRAAFLESSRHELAFWDVARGGEQVRS
jgi:thiaminase (transcriptional activator TenA)